MKLMPSWIELLQEETKAQVVPDDAPAVEQLLEQFGKHTFFLDGDGLHVWELIEQDKTTDDKMVAVQVMAWKDEQRTVLIPHEPKPIHVLLVSESGLPAPSA